MKLRTPSTLAAKDVTMTQSPEKVCLLVLRPSRTDHRAMRTITALEKEGFEVSVIDIECERTTPREETKDGIRWHHLIIPDWHSSRRFQPLFFLVAIKTFLLVLHVLLKSRADIYHAVELTALPVCYIIAKLRRKPLIFEAYELHIPVPETTIAFWRLLGPRLLAVILPHCARIVTVSPLCAEEFRRCFHVQEVSVVRSIPAYRTVQKSNLLRQYLGLREGTRIALYQGGLQRNRGLDRLIHAATFLEDDVVIVLMGRGMGTTLKELETLIINKEVADRVKIIPPVPYENLLDWTASADIGLTIFPLNYSLSIRWCLPNKLFEYIMAGVPVLANELDAVVDIVKTYNIGQIVTSDAPEDIGTAINTMLADSASLAEMRCNALKAAQKELHWEKESQELIGLYKNISGLKRSALLTETRR